MTPRRRKISAILVAIGAIVYGASPIDILPELLLGPIGLADDAAIWIGAGLGIWKLLRGRGGGPGVTPPSR